MIRVIFVCLGNICRSPMAEAVFIDLVEKAGLSHHFEIDSAGTADYPAGQMAHRGTRQVLREHGIVYEGQARQFQPADFSKFDYVLAMDSDNLTDLEWLDRPKKHRRKLRRLLDFARRSTPRDVPDPYYNGRFDYVHELVLDGCEGLLAHIRAEHAL